LLWQLNPPGYYGVREKLRFMTYENVQWPIPGLVRERSALQSALAIAQILGRILILPRFCQQHSSEEGEAEYNRWCTMDELFDIDSLMPQFGEWLRPHSFLSDPRVPEKVLRGSYVPPRLCIDVPTASCNEQDQILRPAHPEQGASQHEIQSWLLEDEKLATAPLLQFSNLADTFQGFQDPGIQHKFSTQISKALLHREEIRRNSDDLIEQISNHTGGYACVDLRGAMQDHARKAMFEAAVARISTHETVFISSEQEAHLNTADWKAFWNVIYQSQLYPWIEPGYRRYQHLAAMDIAICSHEKAHTFIGNPGSLLSQIICKKRGRSKCKWADLDFSVTAS